MLRLVKFPVPGEGPTLDTLLRHKRTSGLQFTLHHRQSKAGRVILPLTLLWRLANKDLVWIKTLPAWTTVQMEWRDVEADIVATRHVKLMLLAQDSRRCMKSEAIQLALKTTLVKLSQIGLQQQQSLWRAIQAHSHAIPLHPHEAHHADSGPGDFAMSPRHRLNDIELAGVRVVT